MLKLTQMNAKTSLVIIAMLMVPLGIFIINKNEIFNPLLLSCLAGMIYIGTFVFLAILVMVLRTGYDYLPEK